MSTKEKPDYSSKEDVKSAGKSRVPSETHIKEDSQNSRGNSRSNQRKALKIKRQYPYNLKYKDTGTQCMVMTEKKVIIEATPKIKEELREPLMLELRDLVKFEVKTEIKEEVE